MTLILIPAAFGNIEIVVDLQVEPELRWHPEIPPKTQRRARRDRTTPADNVVGPRAGHLDGIGKFVNAEAHGSRNASRSISPGCTGGNRRPVATSEKSTWRLSMSSRLMVIGLRLNGSRWSLRWRFLFYGVFKSSGHDNHAACFTIFGPFLNDDFNIVIQSHEKS